MVTAAILGEDSATIVQDDRPAFEWGAVFAGGLIAAATTFFLVLVGAAVGLSLAGTRNLSGMHTFLTIGAIYFLAAQAFGFAIGGHVTGRLMRSTPESEAEHFRADAHGLAVWSLATVIGLGFLALAGAVGVAQAAHQNATPVAYWSDRLLAGAPGADYAARNAEAARLLGADTARPAGQASDAHNQLVGLVAAQDSISPSAAESRVENVESGIRAEAEAARHTLLYLTMWMVFALIFGAFVAVVATVTARFHQEDFSFRRHRQGS